jgi:hypothetical protein
LIFVVTLEPLKGVDGIRAIRAFLKLALRRFGLRCVDVQEVPNSNVATAARNHRDLGNVGSR